MTKTEELLEDMDEIARLAGDGLASTDPRHELSRIKEIATLWDSDYS